MTIFFLKSLLSLPLLVAAALSTYAMFEVFGRSENPVLIDHFKRRHKIYGYIFVVLFVLISYLCIGFAAAAKGEPTPRAVGHIVLALAVAALFLLKVLCVRIYRQFYSYAKIIGIIMAVASVMLVGISGGYYLVVSGFGQDRTTDKSVYYSLQGPFLAVVKTGAPGVSTIRTDRLSIEQGKTLFAARCGACHDPLTTNVILGPGLKGLLKNPVLPTSKHPATDESLRFQLRQPMGRMPSFAYLSEEEMSDLVAYLNTL